MTPIINCNLIDFPNMGREMVIPNEDDSYTVLINARLSDVERMAAYEHAVKHIVGNDFEKENVQEIESVSHREKEYEEKCI